MAVRVFFTRSPASAGRVEAAEQAAVVLALAPPQPALAPRGLFVVTGLAVAHGQRFELGDGVPRCALGPLLVGVRGGHAQHDAHLLVGQLPALIGRGERGQVPQLPRHAHPGIGGGVADGQPGRQPLGHVARAVLAVGAAVVVGDDHRQHLAVRAGHHPCELADRVGQVLVRRTEGNLECHRCHSSTGQ
jgi:hypothetical protein